MSQTNVVDAQEEFAQARELAVIRAAREGDKAAYKQLYDLYINKVYSLCYRLTADKSLAEDATQEVFIQLWSMLANFYEQSKFSTWLHSVTANVTISYIRKQRGWWQRMMNIEDSGIEETAHSDTSAGDVDLEALILRLPERARMVFVLHAVEGYRHEDISKMLNMAVGSSKAQFHRAKQLMSEWMGYDE